VPRSLVMTALCTHRRALKTAPIEFSDSTTEKDCHCIRNNGEWRCSRPIGVNFSKHITRSHGRSSNPNSTQSAQRRKVHREKLWAQKPQGPASYPNARDISGLGNPATSGALGYKSVPTGMREVLLIEKPHLKNDPSLAPFETPFESQGRQGKQGKPFEAQGKRVRHPPD